MSDDMPEAYRIGDQPFLGLTIYLDSRPLIPRPETEWWTEELIRDLGGGALLASGVSHSATAREEAIFQQKNMPHAASERAAQLRFLDLCAGSGAIGCAALKYLPSAEVYFGEIDPAHEATIYKNIRENGLEEARAHVSIGDLFAPFGDTQFDIIAANPPYIPAGRALDTSVTDYEPALALYSGDDGLDLIRRVARELRTHLRAGGELWLECDSAHAERAAELFRAEGFSAEIRTDQYDRPRLLVVR